MESLNFLINELWLCAKATISFLLFLYSGVLIFSDLDLFPNAIFLIKNFFELNNLINNS